MWQLRIKWESGLENVTYLLRQKILNSGDAPLQTTLNTYRRPMKVV